MADYLKKSDFESIILFKLFEEANGEGRSKSPQDIAKSFKLPVPPHRLELALDELYNNNLADYVMANSWKLYKITNKGLTGIENLLVKPDSVLNAYIVNGDDWALPRLSVGERGLDRLITIGHNNPPASEVIADLEAIENSIRSSNEVGSALGDERDVALAEVGALRRMLEATKLRTATFLSLARRTLLWVAEKGGGTAVVELSKIALKHIIAWLT